MTRTPDLLITNQLLYQLSYTSICENRLSPSKFCLLVYHDFALLKILSLTTTGDLLITNQLLYQLSYTSICENRLSPSKFCLLVYHVFARLKIPDLMDNQRPHDYESGALPTELIQRMDFCKFTESDLTGVDPAAAVLKQPGPPPMSCHLTQGLSYHIFFAPSI